MSEDDEKNFQLIYEHHNMNFQSVWQTKLVKLPAKNGQDGKSNNEYSFRVLKLVIDSNGGHPDLSLG